MDRGDGTMYMAGMSAAAPSADAVLSPWTINHLRGEVERLRSTYSFDLPRPAPSCPPVAEAPQAERVGEDAVSSEAIPPAAEAAVEAGTPASVAETGPTPEAILVGADFDADLHDILPQPAAPAAAPEGLPDALGPALAGQPSDLVSAAVEALSRKLDVLDAKAVDPIAIARLQRQTAELKDLVTRLVDQDPSLADPSETASRLQEMGAGAVTAIVHASADFERAAAHALEALEARLAQHVALQREAKPVADEFQSLRDRLDGLSRDMRALGGDGDPRLAGGIAQLLERMDAGGVDAGALGPLVDVLERHLVTLTEQMGTAANEQLTRLDGIERLLQTLTTEMRRLQAGGPAVSAPLVSEAVPAEVGAKAEPVLAMPASAAEVRDDDGVEFDELADLLTSLTRKAEPRPEPHPVAVRPEATREVWHVPGTALAETRVTEAPWQGELRDMLSTAEDRRRESGRAFADERLDLSDLRPGEDWSTRHVAALEAALLAPVEERPRSRSRTDWVAAADRAEHREKGAAIVRKQETARRLNLAVRAMAVATVAAGLGFVTYKLTQQDGSVLGLQASLSAPAMPSVSGGAPVEKSLLGNLPPPVGPGALKTAALAGDADAAGEVGIRYADGKGTDVDTGAAMKWLAFAASRGSVPAAYRLGSMYEHNSRNPQEARKLYQWAADRGNLRSMHNMGVLYSDGIDGKPDWMNAVNWFRKAADLGLRDSQYNLGVIYSRGLAGAVDRAEAWKWFSLAANQGDTESARKRDEVAAKAEGGVVERAKAAAAAFTPGKVVESANAVPVRPEWEVAGPADTLPRKSASR